VAPGAQTPTPAAMVVSQNSGKLADIPDAMQHGAKFILQQEIIDFDAKQRRVDLN